MRWNPTSDMVASSSGDKTASLLDIETGKRLYCQKSSVGSNVLLLDKKIFKNISNSTIRSDHVCLLHVNEMKNQSSFERELLQETINESNWYLKILYPLIYV